MAETEEAPPLQPLAVSQQAGELWLLKASPLCSSPAPPSQPQDCLFGRLSPTASSHTPSCVCSPTLQTPSHVAQAWRALCARAARSDAPVALGEIGLHRGKVMAVAASSVGQGWRKLP